MRSYKNINEFEQAYEKDMVGGLFYETFKYVEVYRKPRNLMEMLFKRLRRDYDNSTYGYELNRITAVVGVHPEIGRVDVEWRSMDGVLRTSRVDPKQIYRS